MLSKVCCVDLLITWSRKTSMLGWKGAAYHKKTSMRPSRRVSVE